MAAGCSPDDPHGARADEESGDDSKPSAMTLSNEGQHQHVEPSGQDPEGADDHKAVPHGGPILLTGLG